MTQCRHKKRFTAYIAALLPLLLAFVFSASPAAWSADVNVSPPTPGVKVEMGEQEKVEDSGRIVLNAQQLFSNATQLKDNGDFDAAAHSYMRLFREYPEDSLAPRALYMAAEATARAGRVSDAVDIYETLIDKYPDNQMAAEGGFKLAALYENTGRAADAVRLLRGLSDDPRKGYSNRATKALVELYLRLSRIYEAQTVIEKQLAENPGDLQFLLQLAKSHETKDEYEKAAGVYEKIMEANPGNRGFENRYFNAVKKAGNLDSLVEEYELQKEKNPDDMAPYHKLKRLYLWDKKSLDALTQLEVIVEREPGNLPDAVELAKAYYANKWVTKAKETLEGIIGKNPGYTPAWRELGDIYFKEKEQDKARRAWEKAAGFNPDDPNTYRALAGYFMPHYLHAEAARLFEKGRDRLGNPNLFAPDLAHLYYNQMQFEKALHEYVRLLAMNPNDKNAANMTYRLATMEEVGEKGLEIVGETARAQPGNLQLQLTWLDVLMTAAPDDEAIRKAEQAAAGMENGGGFLNQLAGQRASRGAHTQAARLYEAAAGMAPDREAFFLLQAARSWLTAGDMRNASALLRRIVDQHAGAAGSDEALMKLASLEEDRGNFGEARGYYARLTAEYPGGPWFEEALVGEARTAFLTGDFQRAAEAFDALAGRPGSSRFFDQILFFRAETKFFTSKIDEALKLYQLVADQYPESSYLNDALERVFFIEDMKEADPMFLQVYISAEKKYIRGDAAGAESALRKLAGMIDGGAPRAHVMVRIGDLLLEEERPDEAAEVYREVLDSDTPLAARAGYRLAGILNQQGRDKEALRQCQKVLDQHPSSYWGRKARFLARRLADKYRLPKEEM